MPNYKIKTRTQLSSTLVMFDRDLLSSIAQNVEMCNRFLWLCKCRHRNLVVSCNHTISPDMSVCSKYLSRRATAVQLFCTRYDRFMSFFHLLEGWDLFYTFEFPKSMFNINRLKLQYNKFIQQYKYYTVFNGHYSLLRL